MTTSLFGTDYQNWIDSILNSLGPTPIVFIVIALCLIGGFGITRICKLIKIPYVTGYILLGVLLGPSLLAFIPNYLIVGSSEGTYHFAGLSFLSDITMGFIAFGCGRYFKWSHLKIGGKKPLIMSFTVALIVGVITGAISYLFYGVIFQKGAEYGLAPAFLFGACAACVSPTATSSIIRQYKATGHFVERVFQNILIANFTAILAFSIILGLVQSGVLGGYSSSQEVTAGYVVYSAFKPIFSTILFCGIGVLFAFILSKLNNYRRTNDSRIILSIAFCTILVAICSIPYSSINEKIPFSTISPLLPCMVFGIVYYNLSKSESLFFQLESFLPPILCLFFVISGAKLNLRTFADPEVVVMALVFILVRTTSQFGATNLMSRAFGNSRNTRKYLFFTVLTMTSVALGLINLSISVIGSNEMITFVYTVVLSACIIFEIVGPIFAKMSLFKTDSVDPASLMTPSDPKLAKRNAGSVSEE